MRISSKPLILLAPLALAIAGPALAQDWRIATDPGWTGALGCTATGVCLALSCDEGMPAQWELIMPQINGGWADQPIDYFTELSVDRRYVGRIDFARHPQGAHYTAPFGPADQALLEALQRGNRAGLRIDSTNPTVNAEIGLRGSTAATRELLAICAADVAALNRQQTAIAAPPPQDAGLPPIEAPLSVRNPGPATPQPPAQQTQPQQPTVMDTPQAAGRAELWTEPSGRTSDNPAALAFAGVSADCEMSGGAEIGPGFVAMRDINGDRINDVAIDFGAAGCAEAPGYYCGSIGCPQEFWIGRTGGEFIQIFAGSAQVVTFGPDGVIDFAFHGSFCDLNGFEACVASARVEGERLVQID